MAWYIEYLLRHKGEIRASIYKDNQFLIPIEMYESDLSYDEYRHHGRYEDSDISKTSFYVQEYNMDFLEFDAGIIFIESLVLTDTDAYSDILSLEKLISDLRKEELLSDDDVILLKELEDGKYFETVGENLGLSRETITKRFVRICDDLDYYSDGIYSDKVLLKKLKETKKLTDKQIETISEYMKSKWKNKLVQKGENADDTSLYS